MTTNTANPQLRAVSPAGSAQRAVIYARISEDRDGDQLGVARQEEACRKLAADLGWHVVGVLVDDDKTAYGKSGQRAKRPAFATLLDMLTAREADAVLVWHVDRLYRQARDLEPLIDVVERTGAVVRPVTHGELDLTTASGRMVARILASVSTHEIEHAQERMREKKAELRAAGHFHGGVRGFGHKPLRKRAPGAAPQIPQTDPREAALIREAAQAVLAYAADPKTGKSLGAICRDWNARKIRTPRGKEWGIPSLRAMLTGARLAALIEFEGEIIGPAQWEPILDVEQWQAVRRVLRDPGRNTYTDRPSDQKIKYLGTGIYRCHKCRETVGAGGSKVGEEQRYRCPAGHITRYAAPIDDAVETAIIAKLVHDAPVVAPKPAAGGADMEELSTRRAALTAQLTAVTEEFAEADEIDLALYRTRARKLREKITAVEEEITDAQTRAAAAREPGPFDDIDRTALLHEYIEHPDKALALWRETYSLERRRKITAALVDVTILPGRRGRPKAGAPVFDPASLDIEWTPAA
ncbi:recombinase family protein [Streptomyces sp. NPDC005374]|uniref:recombinase family protein n=1 Tax=Streptomyces sp. NPDC005374 TaxID=3364713 RepID=UPI00368B0EC9